jgi:hypothetical protein
MRAAARLIFDADPGNPQSTSVQPRSLAPGAPMKQTLTIRSSRYESSDATYFGVSPFTSRCMTESSMSSLTGDESKGGLPEWIDQ